MLDLAMTLYLLAALGTGFHVLWLDWRIGEMMVSRFNMSDVFVLALLWPMTLCIWFEII